MSQIFLLPTDTVETRKSFKSLALNFNSMPNQEYLVTINVHPSLEEAMVDCLLTFEYEDGFSSFPVNAHDHRNEGLSLAEQVAGRQRIIRFQMYVPEDELQALVEKLKNNFSGSGIHYWVLPVIDNGYI